MPSSSKPLLKPMLTQIYVTTWHHEVTMSWRSHGGCYIPNPVLLLTYFLSICIINKNLFVGDCIWVRSWNCGCRVTWFCYQLIAKPGNKTAKQIPYPANSSEYSTMNTHTCNASCVYKAVEVELHWHCFMEHENIWRQGRYVDRGYKTVGSYN